MAGGYDNFEKIKEICKKYDLWLHIDGAWGGGVMVSD